MSRDFDTDVFIVGLGPAGATTALALAKQGIRVQAISRHRWLSNSPRAHITNQRAMEVLRDLGVERAAQARGSDWKLMGETLIAESLTGREFARVRAWGTGDHHIGEYQSASPCPMLDLIQPELELVLVNAAAESGAHLAFSVEYVGHQQDDDGVTVTVRDRRDGSERQVRARYLVGADGANSQVATDAGLPFAGQHGRASTVYAQFTADLDALVSHRPSILYWIASPDTSFGEIGMGLLRAVRPWDKWIAGWGYDPAKGEPDTSEEAVLTKIRALIGDDAIDVRLGPVSTWQVNEAWATEYSNGRVFCMGDAVHRHPPSGGLGSNTSIQDAFNLAWKLEYVVKGYAGRELLDSYTAERSPVGAQIVARANRSRVEFHALNATLRDEDGSPAHAWERLNGPSDSSRERRARLHAALKVKDYEFNAHGVELNQRYASRAVIADPHGEEWLRDPELYAQATTLPGAKLPHAWLVDEGGRRRSTLDHVGQGLFTLVTGIAGAAWREAASRLSAPWLRAVTIGTPEANDVYGDWAAVRGVGEDVALLVRPDGYIAWRSPAGITEIADASAILDDATGALLAHVKG